MAGKWQNLCFYSKTLPISLYKFHFICILFYHFPASGDEAAPSSEDLLQTGRKDEIENVGDDIESASHSTEGSSGSEEDDTGAQLDDVDNDQMTDSGDGGDEEGDGEDEESKNEDSEKDESENDEEDDGEGAGQSGLANVMAKILKKKTPEKKSAILAKAKTDRELQWKKRQAELKAQEEEGDGKVKPEKTMNSFQREREKHIKVCGHRLPKWFQPARNFQCLSLVLVTKN